jgi:hypothetical protein
VALKMHELIFFDDHVHFPLGIEALHALGHQKNIVFFFQSQVWQLISQKSVTELRDLFYVAKTIFKQGFLFLYCLAVISKNLNKL